MRRACLLAPILLAAAPAFADGPPAPEGVTMDRADATTRVGVEGSYEINNNSHNADGESASVGRLEIHGQLVDPRTRLGAYVALPFSFETDTADGISKEYTGIGDTELGAIYAPRIPLQGLGAAFHIGVALPSGSKDQDNIDANTAGAVSRLTDYALSYPDAVSLRLGISPTWSSRHVFARIDVGGDINFIAKKEVVDPIIGTSSAESIPTHNLLRINASIGAKLGRASLALESTNLYLIPNHGDASAGFGANWINTGAVAFRYREHFVEPYAAVVFPLDTGSHGVIDAALTFGIDVRPRPEPRVPASADD